LVTTKLLAVDDSKTMRKVLEITFAGDTYDSKIVGSANEALAVLRADAPQVVIVDGALGDASGYDLCKQVKAEAPAARVLLLSSKQRPYDEAQGSAAGVDGYFDKPFDSTKFLDKVSQLVATAPAAAAQAKAAPPVQRPQAPPARVSDAPPIAEAPVIAPEPRPVVAPAPAPARAAPVQAAVVASAPSAVAAAVATSGMSDKLEGLGLTSDQVQGVLTLSREVVEQVVWEVVPALAETLIKEEIARLTSQ
jgi:CheY-like chemotaxis protein